MTKQSRQLLPGYSVRRRPVPPAWVGHTIADLQIRNRYGVNIIGLVRPSSSSGAARTRYDFDRSTRLADDQLSVMLGADTAFTEMKAALEPEPPLDDGTESD